jgi:hypothetical protein
MGNARELHARLLMSSRWLGSYRVHKRIGNARETHARVLMSSRQLGSYRVHKRMGNVHAKGPQGARLDSQTRIGFWCTCLGRGVCGSLGDR